MVWPALIPPPAAVRAETFTDRPGAYPTRATSALICATVMAWICAAVNELPWVVDSAPKSAALIPEIAATLRAGMPVVLDNAAKRVVVNEAIWLAVSAPA